MFFHFFKYQAQMYFCLLAWLLIVQCFLVAFGNVDVSINDIKEFERSYGDNQLELTLSLAQVMLNHFPDSGVAHNCMGVALSLNHNLTGALYFMKRACEITDNQSQGFVDNFVSLLQTTQRWDYLPDENYWHQYFVEILLIQGKKEQAYAVLLQSLTRWPETFGYWCHFVDFQITPSLHIDLSSREVIQEESHVVLNEYE